MDISGKLIKILPEVRGESQRGPWVRGGFVIETDDMYPKQVAFTLFGEDRLAMINGIQMSSVVTVTFAPESREYNERWYTDLRCIRVVQGMSTALPMSQSMAQPPMQQPMGQSQQPVQDHNFAQQPPMMPDNNNDDLPF